MSSASSQRPAWVVSVSMGYGHERAAYALSHLARGGVISANDYPGIPETDKKIWGNGQGFYEALSRLKPIPGVGDVAFEIMDAFQRIPPFYPRRDLSKPTFQVIQTETSITRLGLCRHLIEKLAKKPLPLICTFFTPAFAAEAYNYPNDIYLTICDADISRAWVPHDPKKSRIKYLAPNGRVVERLKLYGVRQENIFLTGFPLPKELVGGPEASIAKKLLHNRLWRLDPNGIFFEKYQRTLEAELGMSVVRPKKIGVPTLTFAIGGAGAQAGQAETIIRRLRRHIAEDTLHLRLVAGIRLDPAKKFARVIKDAGLERLLGKRIFIDYFPTRTDYFRGFSSVLRTTDILWTKPSELSFYTGLGLPILMAPCIGSQEEYNHMWLTMVGGGISEQDPKYVDEWLFDWLASGALARMAWNGYIEAPTHGTHRIEHLLLHAQEGDHAQRDERTHANLPRLPLIV